MCVCSRRRRPTLAHDVVELSVCPPTVTFFVDPDHLTPEYCGQRFYDVIIAVTSAQSLSLSGDDLEDLTRLLDYAGQLDYQDKLWLDEGDVDVDEDDEQSDVRQGGRAAGKRPESVVEEKEDATSQSDESEGSSGV